jgi:hypothetical protein
MSEIANTKFTKNGIQADFKYHVEKKLQACISPYGICLY